MIIKAIDARRSIRKYKNQEVEEEKINELLESARLAPSGSNTQPSHFIVVRSNENREKIARVSHNQKWMLTAPVHIVCIADLGCRIKESHFSINENSPQEEVKQIIRDTSIAIEHIALQAVELGLGTCWVAWYTQEEFRPILNIPEDKYVVCVLTVGYPDEAPNYRPRKLLKEIVHYEKW